ncbi:MAG: hypothetical protein ACW98F_07095 [Candidatus Hodarchaeales archaeon]|jgi:hypothetical protein
MRNTALLDKNDHVLRDGVVKYSGVLKWFLVIGCSIIVLGLMYFLGIFEIDFEYSLLGAPINSFYGITYNTLLIFGFYLLIVALLLILPTLDLPGRNNLKNYFKLYIFLGMLGLGFIFYSLMINLNILPELDSAHKWFDYFVIGIILIVLSYLFVMSSTENYQELSQYFRVWVLLITIGIAIEIFSLLTYWSLLRIIPMNPSSWGDLYFIGLLFLYIGGLPFLRTYKPTDKRLLTTMGVTSLILILLGLLVYLAPTLALNGILFPISIFKYNRYFDFLIYGSLLLIIGVSLASNNEIVHKYLKKFSTSILMEITNTHFIDLGLDILFGQSSRGSLLFGMSWNVFLFNGVITTLSALIIINSLIIAETDEKKAIEKNQEIK